MIDFDWFEFFRMLGFLFVLEKYVQWRVKDKIKEGKV